MALVLALVLGSAAGCQPPPALPQAERGVLDLRASIESGQLNRENVVPMNGQWSLHPGELLTPADFADGKRASSPLYITLGDRWDRYKLPDGSLLSSQNAATLRLRVLLPPDVRKRLGDALALRAAPRSRGIELWATDPSGRALIEPFQLGVVSRDRDAIRNSSRVIISTLLLPTPGSDAQEIDLLIHLSSSQMPKRLAPVEIQLGTDTVIRRASQAANQIHLLLAGVTMVIGLYHLALYTMRRSELAPLYFGLFCLALTLRQYMLRGYLDERLIGYTLREGIWDLQIRIELIGLYAAVPLFSAYLRALLPNSVARWFIGALTAIGIVLSVIAIAARKITDVTWSIYVMEGVLLLAALYIITRVITILLRGGGDTQAVRFLSIGTLILAVFAGNDVLTNIGVIQSVVLEQYGMFVFIFCQAFVLASQNARARYGAERLAVELDGKNAALSRLDQMKDEFLANTSHELRTPLSGILGLAEALLGSERLTRRSREHLRLIVASGRRLASLVNDILDFAKLRYDHLTLQKRRVDPWVVVDLVLALSRPLTSGKALALKNELGDDTAAVLADENRLQQILTNLIGNAIKFTSEGTVTVAAKEDNGFLEISITDTGLGIAEEDQARMFDAFIQGDGSAVREAGGTGLGLTITRKLVELHGGRIWVRSAKGKGSTFTFSLPLAETSSPSLVPVLPKSAQSQAADSVSVDGSELLPEESDGEVATHSSPARAQPGRERFRVLIVDDDPVNRTVLGSQLTGAGYEVGEEGNGPAALARLKQERFDAVVLDVMMPKMSGYEVLVTLRKTYPANKLPVLLLSAKNQEQDVVEGFRVGTNDYLTKPFSRTEFLSRIETHITLAKTSIAYDRFVPHQFMQLLGKEHVVFVDIGDHVHLPQMTIMFCDVRGFTTLAERLDAGRIFAVLSGLLRHVSPIVRMNRGFVDKFIGDAVMGLFPHSPGDAAAAAVAIQHAVQRYTRDEATGDSLSVGIGIHTGPTMLGTIGDVDRMEATVISDAVNVSARLESLTRWFGVGVLISETALSQIEDPGPYEPRLLGRVRVKGKRQPVAIHELVAGDEDAVRAHKLATRVAFGAALTSFQRGDFATAKAGFEELLAAAAAAGVEDGPVRLYVAQAEQLLKNPPQSDWDGWLDPGVK